MMKKVSYSFWGHNLQKLEEPIERTKRTQSANRRSCHGMEVKKGKNILSIR
jgi:hypothetical protein